MREGIRRGLVQPKVTMQRVPAQIEKQRVAQPEDSPFYKPFRQFAAGIGDAEQKRLADAAQAAVRESVLPAFERFGNVLQWRVSAGLPRWRGRVAACRTARTRYAHVARQFTTTKLTPKEIHDIGLREVARIRGEMEKVKEASGFKGTLPEFFTFLRTDPKFFCADARGAAPRVLATAQAHRSAAGEDFSHLAAHALRRRGHPGQDRARHDDRLLPAARGGRLARGHLLRESLPARDASALGDDGALAPRVRCRDITSRSRSRRSRGICRTSGATASTPRSSKAGASTPSRSARNWDSTTTPIRSSASSPTRCGARCGSWSIPASTRFKWDRERAIAFFRDNAPKAEHDIVNEVDRYISWPGQALAYKIGELKIKELRARADEASSARSSM